MPADRLDRMRVEMASQNLPHTGRMGFELFDKPNWSSSDFSERVNYQRALEAELERTIETMDTVESARVHLVLPHESLFTTEERPAKAAVVVKLRTQRMADETVNSIANLVASAWENLSPDDVTIVSADGRLPLTAGRSSGVPSTAACPIWKRRWPSALWTRLLPSSARITSNPASPSNTIRIPARARRKLTIPTRPPS